MDAEKVDKYLSVFLLDSAMLKETFASADASTYAKVESALDGVQSIFKTQFVA